MIPDPNDEILAIKRRLAAKFNNDLHRIAEDIRSRQHEGEREVVSLPPRRCKPIIMPNQPLHRSGEAIVSEVVNQTSPPGER
jgi:hypothetical protein